MRETTFDIGTADGPMDTYAVRPDGAGPWPAVFFFMDGLGVRAVLRDMARHLAAQGYAVFLPNLYHRGGHADTLHLDTDPSRLGELFSTVTKTSMQTDIGALLRHADGDSAVRPGPVGCVGYCMGGRVALTAAACFQERVAAAASIHGAQLAVDHPDSPHRLADQWRGKIYVAVAEDDPWLQPDETEHLRSALDEAGANHALEIYRGATHGFAVPGLAAYNETAAERHWRRIFELFQQQLQ